MNVRYESAFEKDLKNLKDKRLLKRFKAVIEKLKTTAVISDPMPCFYRAAATKSAQVNSLARVEGANRKAANNVIIALILKALADKKKNIIFKICKYSKR